MAYPLIKKSILALLMADFVVRFSPNKLRYSNFSAIGSLPSNGAAVLAGDDKEQRGALHTFTPSSPLRAHIRQEDRQQADRRQDRADLIDEGDRCMVGEHPERRRADAAHSEGKAEEEP